MEKNKIASLKRSFDEIAHTHVDNSDSVEYWFARELQQLLGYSRWEDFEKAVQRGITACENTGVPIENHFREVPKMVRLGSGSQREVRDYMLTRYACYLIAQNGDPRKDEIAFAQSYFAIQTRKQELIEDRIRLIERMEARDKLKESEKRLSQNIYERGVDEKGFGRIHSKGDMALFGGRTTQDMKDRYGITSGPLADRLPTLTIAAKNLATEMTNYNVEEKDLQGESPITQEHIQNNRSVRQMLGERGIRPEELPPAEDIKKLERRVKSAEKKLVAESGVLPAAESTGDHE